MKSVKQKKHKRTVKRKYIKNKKTLNKKKYQINKKTHKNVHRQRGKYIKQTGGDIPLPSIIKDVNLFTDNDKANYDDIEDYLNPVYGCIISETGYIRNNYYVAKAVGYEEKNDSLAYYINFDDASSFLSPEAKLIKKISREVVPGIEEPIITPTMDVIKFSKPYIIGRYIAFLYFFNKNKIQPALFNNTISVIMSDPVAKPSGIELSESTGIARAFALLNTHFDPTKKTETQTSKEIFHILLYCLWSTCDNMDGIRDYYKGLNKSFMEINTMIDVERKKLKKAEETTGKSINQTPLSIAKQCPTTIGIEGNPQPQSEEEAKGENKPKPEEMVFETLVGKIISNTKPIKVINFQYAKHFCSTKPPIPATYPDCVETTMRNFMNLLFYDSVRSKFDTSKYIESINEHTLEYYRVFDSLNLQLSTKEGGEQQIYGQMMNARDAWSYLIINHANENIRFKNTIGQQESKCSYEVLSGVMNSDNTETNFFQLLKNLTSEKVKKDVKEAKEENLPELNKNIKSIVYEPDDLIKSGGVGKITINYLSFTLTFNFIKGHSFVLITESNNDGLVIDEDMKTNKYIQYLMNDGTITTENYLWYKYTSDSLKELYEGVHISDKISYKFLELISTDLVNGDTRSRTIINVRLLDNISFLANANDFVYLSDDFSFIDKFHNLTVLNHQFYYRNIDVMPDLTPLKKIKSIGDGFAEELSGGLEEIKLENLPELQSIGKKFAASNNNLTKIKLENLPELKSIGVEFASFNSSIQEIKLENLPKLQLIGEGFASKCSSLEKIKLEDLPALQLIDTAFVGECSSLTEINLEKLPELQSIEHAFASGCSSLKEIKLENLPELKTIRSVFARGCSSLEEITLANLPELQSIGSGLGNNCANLKKIKLENLPKLKSLGLWFDHYDKVPMIYRNFPNTVVV
jgi:hypothetical protein